MKGTRNNLRPSAETLEKARIVKKFIEKKYTSLYEEEKTRKEYIDKLIQGMKKLEATKEQQDEAQKELKMKEVEIWRNKRQKMKISDFTSEAIIGKGAFGEVRLCREKRGVDKDRLVAIKKMKKDEMIKKNQSKHVIAEREILAQADNKWIVDLFSSFTDAENLYLVMEYLPGGDLMNQLIKEEIFTEQETRFYMVELVLAIETVHKLNYIHRDIKPDNILLDRNGHIKLSDFGLCKYYENDSGMSDLLDIYSRKAQSKFPELNKIKNSAERRETMKKHHYRNRKKVYSMVGTIDYIAPEVFGKKGYTESVDWWSLGTIMFEMMVGYPPFVAGDAAKTCHKIIQWESNFDIPEDVNLSSESEDLIRRLIDKADTRLGAKGVEDIKKHPFFKGVDWSSFENTTLPPHKPTLKNETDVSNFDDFEDDGSWIPAQSLKSIKRKVGQQNEYESLFIGYSFKKEVDPEMNKHVESIVKEIRRKKEEQRKRNASQEQIGFKRFPRLGSPNKRKSGMKGIFLKKSKLKNINLKSKVFEEGKGRNRQIFKTSDNTSRNNNFKKIYRNKNDHQKKLNDSKIGFNKEDKRRDKQNMQNSEIIVGRPKNITGTKSSIKTFKKNKMKGLSKNRKLVSKNNPNNFSKRKSPGLKKAISSKNKVGTFSKKIFKPTKDFQIPDCVDREKQETYNVYNQGAYRESGNSRTKRIKMNSNRGTRSKNEALKTSKTERKNNPKIFCMEKSRSSKKGLLKNLIRKESSKFKVRKSNTKADESGLRKQGSLGKNQMLRGTGYPHKDIISSTNVYSSTSTNGFFAKKMGKESTISMKKRMLQYKMKPKNGGNLSARNLDKKNYREEKNLAKMYGSQVKTGGKTGMNMMGTKQYRSNIYDH